MTPPYQLKAFNMLLIWALTLMTTVVIGDSDNSNNEETREEHEVRVQREIEEANAIQDRRIKRKDFFFTIFVPFFMLSLKNTTNQVSPYCTCYIIQTRSIYPTKSRNKLFRDSYPCIINKCPARKPHNTLKLTTATQLLSDTEARESMRKSKLKSNKIWIKDIILILL